jgi:N-acyl-D-amino-acid deacylase
VAVNYATLIGHNTVRRAVLGTEDRLPSIGEMARMRSLVWRAMADGAIGFSTGLQYVPGTYASPAEIVELARIAANAGGVYATHLRNEGTELEAAIEETLRVGATTRARVQISHLKVDSPGRWGASVQALDMLDRARSRGIEVLADQYAYTAASSSLGIRFPAWVFDGGEEAMAERLSSADEWPRIRDAMHELLAERGLDDLAFAIVASYPADPSLNGLSMRQVAAKLTGDDSANAQFDAARAMLLAGGASMVYHLMSDGDVERIMRHPFVALASDGGLVTAGQGVPHPRSYGHTARVLSDYVRERKVIPLQEAIRKMTSLPAGHFRLANRGLLKEGYAADVVVFDARSVRDAATFERPHAHPDGIHEVLVNGVRVVRGGRHTGERGGLVLTIGNP